VRSEFDPRRWVAVHGEREEERSERPDDEETVAREEAAAAREAGSIGGRRDEEVDEERQAVEEGGGGEAEGFELSEEGLREQAEHGEGGPDPISQAGEPEHEDAEAEYGEADRVDSTERAEEEGEE
jgi:hypothetical protein